MRLLYRQRSSLKTRCIGTQCAPAYGARTDDGLYLMLSANEHTMMKHTNLIAVAALSLFTSASAFASGGYVRGNVQMYAGPDYGYPGVFMLSAGSPVAIEGCIDGWSWCDVEVGGNRGWVPGGYLQEEYGGQLVLIPSYGVQIGIPIVTFVFGTYWNDYYRNRPWYGQRERWSHFSPQYRSVSSRNGSYVGNPGRSAAGQSRGTTYTSHARVTGSPERTGAASVHTVHSARPSAASAPQHARASTAHSQSTPNVGHGPSAQQRASTPRSTPRVASVKTGARQGDGHDEAKH